MNKKSIFKIKLFLSFAKIYSANKRKSNIDILTLNNIIYKKFEQC